MQSFQKYCSIAGFFFPENSYPLLSDTMFPKIKNMLPTLTDDH